jgi:competence protein ComEC
MQHPFLRFVVARPFLAVLALLLIVDVVLGYAYVRHTKHLLTVAFLDVGQGDAVLIEGPNGNQLLYDAGPPTGAVISALARRMPFYDRSIDVAVLSHPDMDHIGGFADVLGRYDVDLLLESGASSTNGVFDEIERSIARKGMPRFVARRGMRIDLGDDAVADILYPDVDTSAMETNAASIVLRLSYGSSSLLLSGDLPIREEEHLASLEGNGLDVDVLKLGHHGSRTSSSETWLRSTSPGIAIVSAGKDNRYGHPHQEVLALLRKLGIPYLITYEEGDIVFISDGRTIVRK